MNHNGRKVWERSRPLNEWFEVLCELDADLESRLTERERRGGGRGDDYRSRLWGLQHGFLAYLESGELTASGYRIHRDAEAVPVIIPPEFFKSLRGDPEKVDWDHDIFSFSGGEYTGVRIVQSSDLTKAKKPRGRPRKRDILDQAVRIALKDQPDLCRMGRKEGAALVRAALKNVLKNPDADEIAKAPSTVSKAIVRVCREEGCSKT
jgi:hypothetical protein